MDGAALTALTSLGSAFIGGSVAWLVARITTKPVSVTAEAAVQEAINGGFRELMERATDEREGLAAQISTLEATIHRLISHLGDLEIAVVALGGTVPARPFLVPISGGRA